MSHVGYPWYAGQIESGLAISMLRSKHSGDFLVRKCQSHDLHMLHVKDSLVPSGVRSFKIAQLATADGSQGTFFIERGRNFPSIEALINNAKRAGVRGCKLRMPYTEAGDDDADSAAEADKQRKIAAGVLPQYTPHNSPYGSDDVDISNAQRSMSVTSKRPAPSGSTRSRATSEFHRPQPASTRSSMSSRSSMSRSSHDSPPTVPPSRPFTNQTPAETKEDELPSEEEGDYSVLAHVRPPPSETKAAEHSVPATSTAEESLPREVSDDTYEVVATLVRQPDKGYENSVDQEADSDNDLSSPVLAKDTGAYHHAPPVPQTKRPRQAPLPQLPMEEEGEFEETYETVQRGGVEVDAEDDEEYAVVPSMAGSIRSVTAPDPYASKPPPAVPPPRSTNAEALQSSNRGSVLSDDLEMVEEYGTVEPSSAPNSAMPDDLEMVEEYAAVEPSSDSPPPQRPPKTALRPPPAVPQETPQDLPGDSELELVEEYGPVEPAIARPPKPTSGGSDKVAALTPSDPPDDELEMVEEYEVVDPVKLPPPKLIPDAESEAPPPPVPTRKPGLASPVPPRKPSNEEVTPSPRPVEEAPPVESPSSAAPESPSRPDSPPDNGEVSFDGPYDIGDNHLGHGDVVEETESPDGNVYPLATKETGDESGQSADFAAFAAQLNAALGGGASGGPKPKPPRKSDGEEEIDGLSRLNTISRHKVKKIQDENELLKEKLRQAELALAAAATSGGGVQAPATPAPPPPPLPDMSTYVSSGTPTPSMLAGARLRKTSGAGIPPKQPSPAKANPKSAFEIELARRAEKQRAQIKAIHGDAIYATNDVPNIEAAKALKAARDAERADAEKRAAKAQVELAADEGRGVSTKPPVAKKKVSPPVATRRVTDVEAAKTPSGPKPSAGDDDLEALDFLLNEDGETKGTDNLIVDETYDVEASRGPPSAGEVDFRKRSPPTINTEEEEEYAVMDANPTKPDSTPAAPVGPSRENPEQDKEIVAPSPKTKHRPPPIPKNDQSLASTSNDAVYGNVDPAPPARPSQNESSGQSEERPEPYEEAFNGIPTDANTFDRDSSDDETPAASTSPTLSALRANPEYGTVLTTTTVQPQDDTYDVTEPESTGRPAPYVNHTAASNFHSTNDLPIDDTYDVTEPEARQPKMGNPSSENQASNAITDDTYDVTEPETASPSVNSTNTPSQSNGKIDETYDTMEQPANGTNSEVAHSRMPPAVPSQESSTSELLYDDADPNQGPALENTDTDEVYEDGPAVRRNSPGTSNLLSPEADNAGRARGNSRNARLNGRAATMATTIVRKGKVGVVLPGKVTPKVFVVHLSGNTEVPGCGKLELYDKSDTTAKKMAKHTIRVKHITILDMQPRGKKKFALLIVERRSTGDNRYCFVSSDESELESWRTDIEGQGAAVNGESEYDAITLGTDPDASPSPSPKSPSPRVPRKNGGVAPSADNSVVQLEAGEHQKGFLMMDTGRWRNPLQKRFAVVTVGDDGTASLLHFEDETRKKEPKSFSLSSTTVVRSFIPKGAVTGKNAQEIGLTLQSGKEELKVRFSDPWTRSQWQRSIEKACGRTTSADSKDSTSSPGVDRRRTGSISIERGERMRMESTSEGLMSLYHVDEGEEQT